ncbi:MAG: hypothetical protein ACRDKT_16045, partial [Actinomycetota bacterium]
TQVVFAPYADVDVDISGPAEVLVGQEFNYFLVVENAGPGFASDVVARVAIPNGLTTGEGGCPLEGSEQVCRYGEMHPKTVALSFALLTASIPGTYTVRATVTSPTDDPNLANNASEFTVVVHAAADVRVAMAESGDPTRSGRELTYSVTVSNHGPSPATNVVLTDAWTFDTSHGGTVVGVTSDRGFCSSTTTDAVCNLGDLPVGASATATIILIPRGKGTVTDSAGVVHGENDPDPSNDSATESTTVERGRI